MSRRSRVCCKCMSSGFCILTIWVSMHFSPLLLQSSLVSSLAAVIKSIRYYRRALCCTRKPSLAERYSWGLAGDLDRARSMLGCDFCDGGDAGLDGGEAGPSFSRAARALNELAVISGSNKIMSYLNAFVLDSSFFSLSFCTGGVPVRLLLPLSSPRESKLAPGPRPRRPLFVRGPSIPAGPREPVPVLLGLRAALRLPNLRRSSVLTRFELSGGGIWL